MKRVHSVFLRLTILVSLVGESLHAEEETTLQFKPALTYRLLGLTTNDDSVFHKEEHQDMNQQAVMSGFVKGTAGYQHEYLIEPVIRTKRTKFDEEQLELRIEQAYVNTRIAPRIFLLAGRKEEYEGPGVLVNPSDLINEDRKLFDSLYYRNGKMMVRLTTLIGTSQSFSISALPRKGQSSRESGVLARYGVTRGTTSGLLKYSYSRDIKSTWGWAVTQFLGESMEIHHEGRYQVKQRRAEEFRERAFSDWKQQDPSISGLLGIRLIPASQRSVVLEGIFNQSGLTKEEYELFLTSLRTGGDRDREPDDRLLARRYSLVAYIDEKVIPSSSLELSNLFCLDDKSTFTSAKVRYHVSNVTAVELDAVAYRGGDLTEFGGMPFRNIGYLAFSGTL